MPIPSATDHDSTDAGTGVSEAIVVAIAAPNIVPTTPDLDPYIK